MDGAWAFASATVTGALVWLRARDRGVTHLALLLPALLLTASCAEMQPKRYGINELRFRGVEQLDSAALQACLATQPREKVPLGLAALRSPTCGEPPFDKPRFEKRLFVWGWSDWPTYDEAILKLDLERISRWYRARGYYDARVVDVEYSPPAAKQEDENPQCEDGCPVDITIVVEEGEPITVRDVSLLGVERLTPALQTELRGALSIRPGSIFDESKYDEAKEELAKVLREAGHARAETIGEVVIAQAERKADIRMSVVPGPRCRIGKVRVQSQEPVPTGPILATTLLTPGTVYRESELDDAQRAVYALGAFAAVNVRADLDTEAEDVIDIVVEVEPRRKSQVQLGAGIMSGVLATGRASVAQFSVPQWDVHLLGSYEHRNFMGGLRKFRIEERPRMLFLEAFPQNPENSPRFGNIIAAQFTQPGVFEPRTTMFVEANSDYGPDPFQLFFRNDIGMAIGLDRAFWKQRIQLRGAIHQEFMFVTKQKRQAILKDQFKREAELDPPMPGCRHAYEEPSRANADAPVCERSLEEVLPSSYRLPFLEQRVTVDLRDNSQNPTRGAYFSLSLHEAVQIMDKSWNYIRVLPDVRGYAPIGLGMVLAARFAMGAIFILDADDELDVEAQRNGPQAYRLRGGGAQSNRGFLPGQLGDSRVGGTRSWESSVELRIPLSESFSIVGFGDVGDVAGCPVPPPDRAQRTSGTECNPRFRWERLNTSFGGGLRYRTIVGPIRLDVGARPKNLQRMDGGPGEDDTLNLAGLKFRGAIHLTIGEAF